MIWRLTYCNKNGVEARVDIIKGGSTPVEIVQGSEQPFTISYRLDKNDKSGHIMTSSADIEIFETETFNIDDLKTSNETELKVEYFESNILTWSGFILPDFFSIEIGSPNIIRMTASDRLSALKGITLSDLPTKVSLRDLIELSLEQTGLSLALVSQVQINQGATNILDSEILSQRLTDVRGRSISCYDILMSIMVGTNATIRQRANQWQVYNKLEHELRTPTIFFDKVGRGAIRTIQPVASSVGVYNEFGGSKTYPDNYDFSDGLTGWTAVNGFVAGINNKEVIGYTLSSGNFLPIYGNNVETNSVINKNKTFSIPNTHYLKSENVAVSYPDNDNVNVTVEVNATGVGSYITNSFVEFAVIATNTVTLKQLSLSNTGIFETMTANVPHLHRIKFPTVTSLYNASTGSLQVEGALIAGAENLGDYDIHVRIYGSGENRTSFINSTTIKFSVGGDMPKGNLYKTTQGSNFTKQHNIETAIFGDYIRGGINGHFYYYPIDDTSNLYLPSGELSSPTWKTILDTTERPLLHHVSRQKSRLFSVAHDILRANIDVESFDPLAVFQDCKGGKYVIISANFDFLRSSVDVELEQIAYDDTILKRDFIYSYFGEGEGTIKSIGGISGGGGGAGGGLTPEQIEILSWWKKDPDNPDTIFTEMNAYSTGELSAYGVGSGGGGGSDFDRLDTWANYDSSKSGWVLSAFLGNDLNTRVGNLEGGSALTINTTGTGNAITSISKSGTVITANKGAKFAELGTDGFVLTSQLPSYVDDVLEFATLADFPTTGESGKIYVAINTNLTYRWTGTTYVEISKSLALGTTSSTAYRGDHGLIAYDHSQSEHQTIINGTGFVKANGKMLSYDNTTYEVAFTKNTAFNKNFGTTSGTVAQGNDSRINNGQTAYTWGNHASAGYALNTALTAHINNVDNPHAVTKSQVGLGNVLNVASYSKTESDTKYPTLTNFNAHVADTVKHITANERTAWNNAVADSHTHTNKTQIDGITALHLQILSKLNVDASGNLYATENFYSVGGVSAYGPGIGDDSGIQSAYDVWLSAGNTGTKDDFFAAIVAPAITAVQSYTEAEKLIARTNIGALSASAVNDVTNYNEINI